MGQRSLESAENSAHLQAKNHTFPVLASPMVNWKPLPAVASAKLRLLERVQTKSSFRFFTFKNGRPFLFANLLH